MRYEAYIKGHYDYTKNRGGAAYIIIDTAGDLFMCRSVSKAFTNPMRLEILAALSVITAIPVGSEVVVHTNSKYAEQVLNDDVDCNKERISNTDLLEKYYTTKASCKITARVEWNAKKDNNKYMSAVDKEAFKQMMK